MTVWAYYRVSTDKQDYEVQKFGVVEYAKRAGISIDVEICDDGVSGTVRAKERKLDLILQKMKSGDTIITSELSRLGRSTSDVINTCNLIAAKKVNCYLIKQGMQLDQTPMGKLMISIFAAFAEMERDLISIRTKEAFAQKKARGERCGKPFGCKNKSHKLDGKYEIIKSMAEKGCTASEIAKAVGCSKTLIYRVAKERPDIPLKKFTAPRQTH